MNNQITNTSYSVWNFTDTTPVSNLFPSCQGANRINLQQFIARFLIQNHYTTSDEIIKYLLSAFIHGLNYAPL